MAYERECNIVLNALLAQKLESGQNEGVAEFMIAFYCIAYMNENQLTGGLEDKEISICLSILKSDGYVEAVPNMLLDSSVVIRLKDAGIAFLAKGGYSDDLNIRDPKYTSSPPNNTPINKKINWGNVWGFIGTLLTLLTIIMAVLKC